MPDDDTWTTKEVFTDLKSDIMGRFDKQDVALVDIRHELSNTATKDDLRQVHRRIDGIERDHGGRITALEVHHGDETAVRSHKRRVWAVAGTVAGIAAIIGGSLLGALVH